MSTLATILPPFAIVVIAVGVIGCAVTVIALLSNRDRFRRASGELWMFHGEPDSGPHQMSGARDEDRHLIDPTTETIEPVAAGDAARR